MSSPESAAPVRVGDLIASKYRVERVLGAGGMGVVVLATHVDLEQHVAIKFLLAEASSDSELVERFLREGRASVRLRGQHVVKTHDVGRLDDGAPFLVMEFLKGETLRDNLEHHPKGMPVETMCSFLLQACEGVAEAHALGIVHRDLKPENLFVTHGVDGWPLLKVLDFGISKIADEGFAGALTRTNSLFGSPMYMSPEQMRSAKHVDPRADIWSLGVIAYELACGRPPFDSETMYDLCLKVAQDTPQSLLERRPELPPALVAGIMHCLEKPIGDRTQNVAELAAVLEPYAGPRARGTADRLRDVIRASGAAFASLSSPDNSASHVQVQSAWGATERMAPRSRRRKLVPFVVAALAGVGILVATSMRSPPQPDVTSGVQPPLLPSVAPPSLPIPVAMTSAAAWTPIPTHEPDAAAPAQPVVGSHSSSKRPGVTSGPSAPVAVTPAPAASIPAAPPPQPPKPSDDFVDNR